MAASNSTFPNNIKVTFIYPKTILVNVEQGKQPLPLKSVFVKSDILFFFW